MMINGWIVSDRRLEDELTPDDLRINAESLRDSLRRGAYWTAEDIDFYFRMLNWAADRIDRLEGREPVPLQPETAGR
jgi:hypothetical protein